MTGLEPRESKEEIFGFRILKKLGEGGTARVYAATAPGSDVPVALKVFRTDHLDPGELTRRIAAEIQAYRSLEHPNIVKVIDLPRENVPALVLEYVEGWTLTEFQNRLPYILPEISVRILIEALRGVEHAHACGIIHRDLKPSNILIAKSGRVLVTDFGLAKITDASLSTQTGTILGSPHYMAPEQARGDVTGPRSDVFSLTSVLYFLVTGTPPFGGGSPLAVLATVIERRLESARQRNPKVSWELARILEKGFAKLPSERFASAGEFREALENYLAGLGLGTSAFAVPEFLADPHGETLRALNTIAEKIALRCEQAIRAGRRADALELLSHLSLVAPNSQMIQDLTGELDRMRAKSGWIRRGWIAALVAALIGGFFLIRENRDRPRSGPVSSRDSEGGAVQADVPATLENVARAPIRPSAQAPLEGPAANAVAESKSSPKPKAERVVLDLPPGFTVEWDGRKIPAEQRSFRADPGAHRLVLKVGKNAFRQTVQVVAGEPTNIRVNPQGSRP